MVQATIRDKNIVIVLYVLNLAQGVTLLYMFIKANTVDRCMYAATKLSAVAHQIDPRLDIYGQKSEYIKKVPRKQKCWEDMPNRYNPVTSNTIEEMWEISNDLDLDSLESTLLDWNILERYLGFCLSEQA